MKIYLSKEDTPLLQWQLRPPLRRQVQFMTFCIYIWATAAPFNELLTTALIPAATIKDHLQDIMMNETHTL